MKFKPILYGTFVYTIVTFPLAIVWHVMLFEDQYFYFGYFDSEPGFVLGLITIVIQGLVLSVLYPRVTFSGKPVARGLKYSLLMGVFFWTSHVLAFIAKQTLENAGLFAAMESFYLLIQFGIFGVLLGLIFRNIPYVDG